MTELEYLLGLSQIIEDLEAIAEEQRLFNLSIIARHDQLVAKREAIEERCTKLIEEYTRESKSDDKGQVI